MHRPENLAGARHGIGQGTAGGGPGLLIAAMLTQAVLDYFDADPASSDDARWFLANEGGLYGQHLAALGVEYHGDDCPPVPADLRPFVIRLIDEG
jgi:hypothetical protein